MPQKAAAKQAMQFFIYSLKSPTLAVEFDRQGADDSALVILEKLRQTTDSKNAAQICKQITLKLI